jgi:glycine/D-amino acid oxidase-like deaminating enzyme
VPARPNRIPAAPLAAGYREAPLWHAGVPGGAALADDAELPRRADVVVVGAGYCGASAAWQLAARGRSVVALEAGPFGAGASTRNGGMVLPELKLGPRELTRRYGPLGGELADAAVDAFDLVERLAGPGQMEGGQIAGGQIDCDYVRTGALLVAHHDEQLPKLRSMAAELSGGLGLPARFLLRDELRAELGSDAFNGGVLLERAGGLQPARFYAGILAAAREAGAGLYEHTRALAVRSLPGRAPAEDRFQVFTTRGPIAAADVLVATNAYADDLLPRLQRRVLPVGSFIIATEVLDEALRADLIPHGRMVFDTRHLLAYWRLSPDGRMVFGGRTSLAPTTVARARDVLYDKLVHIHPQLAGAPVEFAWGGNVAITRDRLPHCGRIDGVAFATGCNGSGVALATWFGFAAAAWLTGAAPPPAFAQLPFPAIPLHALRDRYLPLAGEGLRVLDRLGR